MRFARIFASGAGKRRHHRESITGFSAIEDVYVMIDKLNHGDTAS
jgi:hypothetical protein